MVKIEANSWYRDITAMLDSRATSKFINQTLLKELDLVSITQMFCTLSGHAYNQYKLVLKATDTTNCMIGTVGTFIATNLKWVHMILGLFWLIQ